MCSDTPVSLGGTIGGVTRDQVLIGAIELAQRLADGDAVTIGKTEFRYQQRS